MAKLATLADDFPGSGLDAAKWTATGGTPVVSAHRLLLDTAGGALAVTTVHAYDAVGSELIIRSAPSGSADPDARVSVVLASPDGALGVYLLGSLLAFRIDRAGAATDVSKPYDPSRDVYWRIRESMGQVLFATSPTRVSGSWTTYRQEFHRLSLSSVTVTLTAAGYTPTGSGWGHGMFGHGGWGGA